MGVQRVLGPGVDWSQVNKSLPGPIHLEGTLAIYFNTQVFCLNHQGWVVGNLSQENSEVVLLRA